MTPLETEAAGLAGQLANLAYRVKKNLETGQGLPQAGTFATLGAQASALEFRLALTQVTLAARGGRS